MSRPARVFLSGELPKCAKCGRPSFVVLGPLLVCDSKVHKHGQRRTCGTAHYWLQDPAGNSVMVRVTEDEVDAVKDSDLPTATLQSLGLPQMAQEMLSGMRRAA